MDRHYGNSARFRLPSKFTSRAFFTALCIGLVLSATTTLWPQSPANPTFEEIEKHAAGARDANQLDQAAALYREGLRLKPNWPEGSWYLGTSLYGLKRYGEARDAFRHLALSQPGNGQAWALAGMCEFELKNYPRALEYLSRAESSNLGGKDELAALVHFRVALLLNREGNADQALIRLRPIVAAGTYPEVIEALGLTTLRAPLLPSEIPEQDRDLYMSAGEAMYDSLTHDNEGAARLFEELVTTYPNRPNVHNARGIFLLESDPEKAIVEFQRELDINPSQPNAMLHLAMLYLKQGSPEKAVGLARQAVRLSPGTALPHRLLGQALLDSGDTSSAVEELQTAAQQEPEHPQTHFLLAQAYKRAGNSALAAKEMSEFERLDQKEKNESGNVVPPK
jgi:tetratricopeptide (TPR) repeat protein